MYPRQDPPPGLLRLAACQDGALTREQALSFVSAAVLRRLLGQGTWVGLAPGIVQVHAGPMSFGTACWAGVLLGGDNAAVSGLAAWARHGLGDEPDVIELVLPHPRRRVPVGRWHFRSARHPVETRAIPPMLAVETTVLVLCRDYPDRLEHWVTTAVGRHVTTPRRILSALTGWPRHPQRRVLTRILAEVAEGAQSPLELDFLRTVERAHHLPQGRRQRRRGNAVTDVDYLGGLVVVELDGRRGHELADTFRDMSRDNRHQVQGSSTLRFGWVHVRQDPCACAMQVALTLRQHGWGGWPEACGPGCHVGTL